MNNLTVLYPALKNIKESFEGTLKTENLFFQAGIKQVSDALSQKIVTDNRN